jgi:hypothetical protein
MRKHRIQLQGLNADAYERRFTLAKAAKRSGIQESSLAS